MNLETLENRITPASIQISNSDLIIRDNIALNIYSINQNMINVNGVNYNVPNTVKNIVVYGSSYNDSINLKNSGKVCFTDGGDGNDTITGSSYNDLLWGGRGNDSINGDAGNDQLSGGPGNDTIKGNLGNDSIYGDAGEDKLFGEDGNDYIVGGNGWDLIVGGKGVDTLSAYDCNLCNWYDEVWTDDIGVRTSVFSDLVGFNRGLDWINGNKTR
jgi:Ca2+-binding RTX toxin-like protein